MPLTPGAIDGLEDAQAVYEFTGWFVQRNLKAKEL
jgi:hypothetical protein